MTRGIFIAASAAILSIALSFLHPFGNPRSQTRDAQPVLLRDAHMPVAARTVLVTKCADCHSADTRWPAYAHLAPASWLLERDVVEARKKLNLSLWNQLSSDQQQLLKAQIIQQARQGHMPPLQYRVVHWSSRLSAADISALSLLSTQDTDSSQTPALTGDAARGKAVFEKRCTGCHALNADREGPRLAGVYGRKAGTIPGFNYSTALKTSGITWDQATLEKWLRDSDAMVPGNNMDFQVPKAQDRADLIAFFKQ